MTSEKLNQILAQSPNPFAHHLQMTFLPGKSKDCEIMICMHGMGGDYHIGQAVHSFLSASYHTISFNFPDYGWLNYNQHSKTAFGTLDEVLTALYVLKCFIIDGLEPKVHLYGFSAGGGVIINLLAVLNSNRHDLALQGIGIGSLEKQQIIAAIQKGTVILEVPLKSFDELVDRYPQLQELASRARQNAMVPIQNIAQLKGLKLNILVYFSFFDEILGNRDDQAFIKLLSLVNSQGKTRAIIGKTKGHNTYHRELWHAYQEFK